MASSPEGKTFTQDPRSSPASAPEAFRSLLSVTTVIPRKANPIALTRTTLKSVSKVSESRGVAVARGRPGLPVSWRSNARFVFDRRADHRDVEADRSL
jgi:hypothetical protein